jgi:hypothetical protein
MQEVFVRRPGFLVQTSAGLGSPGGSLFDWPALALTNPPSVTRHPCPLAAKQRQTDHSTDVALRRVSSSRRYPHLKTHHRTPWK